MMDGEIGIGLRPAVAGRSGVAGQMGGATRMGGPVSDRQVIAMVLLWRHGRFDTLDIAELLGLGEDQVARTLHAARGTARVMGDG